MYFIHWFKGDINSVKNCEQTSKITLAFGSQILDL